MIVKDNIIALLSDDATLSALLPGGFYDSTTINRQSTPGAFDANSELRTCALLNFETETPLGPYQTSARAFFRITFYIDSTGTARERAFALLNYGKVSDGVWQITHADDVLDAWDDALKAWMDVSRYAVVRLK